MQYLTQSASEDILLFEGQMSLTPGDQGEPITAEGRVWFKWEPSPRPYFGLHSNDAQLIFGREEATVVLHPDEVQLATSNVAIGGAGEFPVHGTIERVSLGDAESPLASVMFHVTNFTNYAGGSLSFDVGEWRITITPASGITSLIAELRYRGGFGITHIGKIERQDGGVFVADDVTGLLSFLFLLLSFARGLWTGPILPLGIGANGQVVWQSWGSWKLGRWRGMPTWFDELIPNALGAIAPEFWRRWEDPQWHRPLQTLVSSLVETNTTPSTEVRLLIIQTTLELLSWMLLVETQQVHNRRKFDKLSAADKIRALLSHYDVGYAIPQELAALSSLTSARRYKDGPDACTQLRNGLVHPHEKGRRRVETLLVQEKFEAAQLLHWFAEVVFLKDLGYSGKYGNRLRLPRWSGDLDDLP
ncbi:MAG: hypothetical protein H0V97_09160 [Actinobacteria bacterium]|nr:hypothetical protein [Actinomycetota bacterium]